MAPPVNVKTQSKDKRKPWWKRIKTKFKKLFRKKYKDTQESETLEHGNVTESIDEICCIEESSEGKIGNSVIAIGGGMHGYESPDADNARKNDHLYDWNSEGNYFEEGIDHCSEDMVLSLDFTSEDSDHTSEDLDYTSEDRVPLPSIDHISEGYLQVSKVSAENRSFTDIRPAKALQFSTSVRFQSNIKAYEGLPELESQNETNDLMEDQNTIPKEKEKSMHSQKVVENMPLPDPVAGHEETQAKVTAVEVQRTRGELESPSYEASSGYPGQRCSSTRERKCAGFSAAEILSAELSCLTNNCNRELTSPSINVNYNKEQDTGSLISTENIFDKDNSSTDEIQQHSNDVLVISKTEKIDKNNDIALNPEQIGTFNEEADDEKICKRHSPEMEDSNMLGRTECIDGKEMLIMDPATSDLSKDDVCLLSNDNRQIKNESESNHARLKLQIKKVGSNYFCKYSHCRREKPDHKCFDHRHYSFHITLGKENVQTFEHEYKTVRSELEKTEPSVAYKSSSCDFGVVFKFVSSWRYFTPDTCSFRPCIYPVRVVHFDQHGRTSYRYEWTRFLSFDLYSGNGSGIVLARNGFYHDRDDGPTSTRCYACNATCSDWEFYVFDAAGHHRQNCRHLNNVNSMYGNIPIHHEAASQAGRGNGTATSDTAEGDDETTAMTAAGDTSAATRATHNNIPVAMLSRTTEQTSVQSQNNIQTLEETTSHTEHRSATSTRQQTEATNANREPTTISQPVTVSEPGAVSQLAVSGQTTDGPTMQASTQTPRSVLVGWKQQVFFRPIPS